MPTPTTATPAGRRSVALADIRTAATALLNLGTISVQREIHNALAAGHITPAELHLFQSEWNGVQDHLESLIETLSDNHPDNNDRDAGRVCATCQHDLETDADFRCLRCGTPS